MKRTVIAILIAVLVVAIGGALVFAGLSAVKFKFRDLDTTGYVTNTHEIGNSFARVEMYLDTAEVTVQPAADGKCRVVCEEQAKYPHTVTVENGALIVRAPKDQKWSAGIGLLVKSPSVTVYLPAADYESLQVAADTGAVKLVAGLSFDRLDVELGTGDLTLNGVQADKVAVRGSTGDIRLSDMTPGTVDVSVSTGKIVLTNVVCTGDLRCESTTGDIRLTDVDGANLYLKASTGDITGTVRTPKTFLAHASTGSVRVPDAAGDGRCEAQTSTGDIKLSVSGND